MLSDQVVPLTPEYIVDYDDALGVDCDQAAADVAVFPIPFKCTVQYAALAVSENCGGDTTTPVVKFDKRPTSGSDTGRGDGDIAELKLSTTAAGKTMYDLVSQGQTLEPGEEVVVELATAATGDNKAGHVRPILVVKYSPEVMANLADMVETT